VVREILEFRFRTLGLCTRRAACWIAAWTVVVLPCAVCCAQEERLPLIKRLDGATRAKVLAALAGLIILGFAMVVLIWLGARFTQRYRNRTLYFQPTPRPGEHDWAKRPMGENPREERGTD
jgi:hypothetical protein